MNTITKTFSELSSIARRRDLANGSVQKKVSIFHVFHSERERESFQLSHQSTVAQTLRHICRKVALMELSTRVPRDILL